jgi:hypothetical protein
MIGNAWKLYKAGLATKGNALHTFNKTLGQGPVGFAAWTAFSTAGNMKQGDSFGIALGKGAMEGIAWGMAPGVMLGLTGGQLAYGAIKAGIGMAEEHERTWNARHNNNVLGGNYMDTQHAYNMRMAGMKAVQQSQLSYTGALTQRQAAVQAIAGSKLNARSALGTEASLLHVPY